MNTWLPVVVVLFVGLAAGLGFALARLKKDEEPAGRRAKEGAGKSTPLQAQGAELDSPELSESSTDEAASPAIQTATASTVSSIKGFAWGIVSTLVVGGLVLWAVNSPSRPGSEMAAPMGGATAGQGSGPMGDPGDAHQTTAGMSPEEAAQVEALYARLEADPTDVGARKELSMRLVSANQLVLAFEEAKKILDAEPNDPDGLYVQAVVRYAMGQAVQTVELTNRVIEQYPEHVLALLLRGSAFERMGQLPMAIASWEHALAAAGGSQPEIEQMLDEARAKDQGLPVAGSTPPSASGSGAAAGATSASREASGSGASVDGPTYKVRIELASDVEAQDGATLFVALREGFRGAPAAARKIENPTFPLDIELSHGDSMMGAALPESGTITARLDADGNAFTQEPTDPSAQADAESGDDTVRLVLEEGAS